jgi:hypothetical protein
LMAPLAPGKRKLVSPNKAARLNAPMPIPHRDRKPLRVRSESLKAGW